MRGKKIQNSRPKNAKNHVISLLQMQAFNEDNKMRRRTQEMIERKRNHSN
jgi:hypothetical protein